MQLFFSDIFLAIGYAGYGKSKQLQGRKVTIIQQYCVIRLVGLNLVLGYSTIMYDRRRVGGVTCVIFLHLLFLKSLAQVFKSTVYGY